MSKLWEQENNVGDMRMDFIDYQKRARTTAIYPTTIFLRDTIRYEDKSFEVQLNWVYPSLKIAGEVGEVSEKLGKAVRDKQGRLSPEDKALVMKELGDILWYVSNLATEFGLDLDDIAIDNLAKLASRKERGVLHGEGDNR